MKISEALGRATELFQKAGIESPEADAQILLGYVLECSRGEVLAKAIAENELSDEQASKYEQLTQKRSERVPLQHLTGVASFRQLELVVGPGVFVPRFETEVVAGIAIDFAKTLSSPVVVDLATGSGAIALAIATEVPNAQVHAVELSESALEYTKQNFRKYSPESDLRQGDLSQAFSDLDGQVDVVVSNPPYIPDEMIPIYPEVHLHDPKLALYGGPDGLDVVRLVEQTAKRLLKPEGKLVIEHADMQGEPIRQLLLATGWKEVTTHKDLAGRDRAVSAVR